MGVSLWDNRTALIILLFAELSTAIPIDRIWLTAALSPVLGAPCAMRTRCCDFVKAVLGDEDWERQMRSP
jgi:hypothetical protein